MASSHIASGTLDFLSQRAKPVAKRLYGPAIIAAAGAWRRVLRTELIGITGSAGKTTTKELLYTILSSVARTVRSHDSDNQLYDVARTLMRTSPRVRYGVFEVGASEPGGFDPMLELLRPRVGIVTNVGEDHYKAFRGPEAVAAEKGKLIAALPADGIAILNADDPRVLAMAARARARIVTFGTAAKADLHAESMHSRWPEPLRLQVYWDGRCFELQTRLHGKHQASCVLAALAASGALGVPLEAAVTAMASWQPPTGRMSAWSTPGGVHFLRDDFKAPAWSLPASLEVMAEATAPRRIIVLGTVSDYGGNSRKVYRRAVSMALQASEIAIVIGDRADSLIEQFPAEAAGNRLLGFGTVREASQWLHDAAQPGDLVLLKGSISDHLSRLALQFERDVRCWQQPCKRMHFCERCPLLASERA